MEAVFVGFKCAHLGSNISLLPDDKNGVIYSINEVTTSIFPQGVIQYIKYCQVEDKVSQRPYTSRYIGSIVADLLGVSEIYTTLFRGKLTTCFAGKVMQHML